MTQLLIDVGNSRIKWATTAVEGWAQYGAADTVSLLASQWQTLAAPEHIWACCVASPAQEEAIAALSVSLWGVCPQWLRPTTHQCGVRNGYESPEQLGADRWASLLGARHLYPDTAMIVVSAGTALVADALRGDGVFPGGLIMPGYRLLKVSLAQQTARLPLAQGAVVDFPTHSHDAIETGCVAALVGAIERMRSQLVAQQTSEPLVVLSGGDAPRLLPYLNSPVCVVDNLVLHGLLAWAQSVDIRT